MKENKLTFGIGQPLSGENVVMLFNLSKHLAKAGQGKWK